MQQRGDVDTVIDVHTHPFCERGVAFSSTDDHDETDFLHWLTTTLDDIHYGSIVLSRTDYAARLWSMHEGRSPRAQAARIKTQVVTENWPCAMEPPPSAALVAATDPSTGFLARSVLALGLDNLRRMLHDQRIAVVGVGGLGSVIAEHLVHTGFQTLDLIDPDVVEVTNLNRIVGAGHADAQANRLKVDVVKAHLHRINPQAEIAAYPHGIETGALLPVLAQADWIMLASDSHFSRFKAQEIALRFGIPLISSGVNITVNAGKITDMSGEVIVARSGDHLCLHCLGRVDTTAVSAEAHRGHFLGEELIRRGYVQGEEVKEPAVKTLNTMLATLAVDVLINQYTERQPHVPVWVYENNRGPCIYPDTASVMGRAKDCFYCG